MSGPNRAPGPMTAAARMLRRCRRHSPAWRAHVADLEAALKDWRPGPWRVLPPGPAPLTDRQIRQSQRHDPAGRMRGKLLRALRASSGADAHRRADEAAYRLRIDTALLGRTGDGLAAIPLPPGDGRRGPRGPHLCDRTARAARYARARRLDGLRDRGDFERLVFISVLRAYAFHPDDVGLADEWERLRERGGGGG